MKNTKTTKKQRRQQESNKSSMKKIIALLLLLFAILAISATIIALILPNESNLPNGVFYDRYGYYTIENSERIHYNGNY